MNNKYEILPFKFGTFNQNEVILVNEVGEFIFISKNELNKLANYQLDTQDEVFLNLKAKHIVTDTDISPIISMLSIKYRTKKGSLNNFTNLHMVVPTLRCNSNCIYCQVSRKNMDLSAEQFDMNKKTAKKTVDLIFSSPSPYLKIEFQGGEPLLNFNIIKYIIEYAEYRNLFKNKKLEFILCSNLSLITEKMLNFLKKHPVFISTSLDGPKDLHIKNRPTLNDFNNNYDNLLNKIRLCRQYLGDNSVSALMTTTRFSINRFKEIIEVYVSQGFHSIFLRSLNPYGIAKLNESSIDYSMEIFIKNYIEALNYIIELNTKGIYFIEYYALLFLTKMLTPFTHGFVDMQSPAGVAISGVVYDYNGNVYVSDEARMLAAMGNKKFLMGNVHTNSYQELFNNNLVHQIIRSSCLECLPECAYCVYQNFCGTDPVRNYYENGDIIGNRPKSDLCKRNKAIMRYILGLIKKKDQTIENIFWSWITGKPHENNNCSVLK